MNSYKIREASDFNRPGRRKILDAPWLGRFLAVLIVGFLSPNASFSQGPISRSFGKIELGSHIKQMEERVEFEALEEKDVRGVLGKGERFYYIPTVSARPGIEGVYGLFFEDTLYQIVIQYNARYSDDVSWGKFTEGMVQRYGKPDRKGENHQPKSKEFFVMAGFASKVIQVQGFQKIMDAQIWEDSETSLGVFQGRVTHREERRFHGPSPEDPKESPEIETNYIVIYSDRKLFEGLPRPEPAPDREDTEEDPLRL